MLKAHGRKMIQLKKRTFVRHASIQSAKGLLCILGIEAEWNIIQNYCGNYVVVTFRHLQKKHHVINNLCARFTFFWIVYRWANRTQCILNYEIVVRYHDAVCNFWLSKWTIHSARNAWWILFLITPTIYLLETPLNSRDLGMRPYYYLVWCKKVYIC